MNVHVDAFWKAADVKAHRQSTVMNVGDLVSDGDGSLSSSMTIKTFNTIMKERNGSIVWQTILCFSLSSRHWRPDAR